MTKKVAYKGFNKGLVCRGFKYELGKTYKHEGEIELCGPGFHACEQPLDVFTYYPPSAGIEYAIVEQSGEIEKGGDKTVSSEITVRKKLSLKDLCKAQVDFVSDNIKKSKESTSTNDNGFHTNTSAHKSHAITNGVKSHASTNGDGSHASTRGYKTHASTCGKQSHASTNGMDSHASTCGYRSHAITNGVKSHASTNGDGSHASTCGYRSRASTCGYRSRASASGERSTAACLGLEGKAKAGKNGVIILTYFDEESDRHRVAVGYVGEDGIKKDTWYEVVDGRITEVNG